MKKIVSIICLIAIHHIVVGQFAPAAGKIGSTAIFKDSSIFVAWATGCTISKSYMDVSHPSLGIVSAGDSTMALGKAGSNGIVSLGDGGTAIVTFANPIFDKTGYDFAIFENSFLDTFLELAFVEVSSDGINYFRFPSISNTQDTLQIGAFDYTYPTKINNLAGKYRANYGTPFDLKELDSINGLNIDSITHIKIIDVVGSIQNTYATYDSKGNKINDPWPTPFASSGFDLDAVGLIHTKITGTENITDESEYNIYPNPAQNELTIVSKNGKINAFKIMNVVGEIVFSNSKIEFNSNKINIDINNLKGGVYLIQLEFDSTTITKKIVIAR
ncbi:MAG: hypothetical protein RIQ33_1971 [Bacteroidota bacterium]|jgi:hypothetical protein